MVGLVFILLRTVFGTYLAIEETNKKSITLKNENGGYHEHPYTDKRNDE